MREVTVTVSGRTGSGKSAIMGAIRDALVERRIPVQWGDPAAAIAEENGGGFDLSSAVKIYNPQVTLIEINQPVSPPAPRRWWHRLFS